MKPIKEHMKIYYVDLEDLPQRYTGMMNAAIRPHVDVVISGPVFADNTIAVGEFLDVNRTIAYKAAQLMAISELFQRGEIKKGDTFLIGDVFFPGIESLRYMAELQGIEIKMFAFNYAGRADKNDFVQKLGHWADLSEHGYHYCMDGIFVGSKYHKDNVLTYLKRYDKVRATGYIWDRSYVKGLCKTTSKKKPYVIWPHRLSAEKGLEELVSFIKTTKRNVMITSSGRPSQIGLDLEKKYSHVAYAPELTKESYYKLMSEAEFYLSTAHQETFGYTLQEAIHFGCKIAVPRRACYPEMVPNENTYKDITEVEQCWEHPVDEYYTERWNNNVLKIIKMIKG